VTEPLLFGAIGLPLTRGGGLLGKCQDGEKEEGSYSHSWDYSFLGRGFYRAWASLVISRFRFYPR